VPFSRQEYKAVYRTAKSMGISLVKQQFRNGHIYFMSRSLVKKMSNLTLEQLRDRDLPCPFLGREKDGKACCRIYDLRPQICRIFGSKPEHHPTLKCPYQEPNMETIQAIIRQKIEHEPMAHITTEQK
jgi:Fe-S-cluster containining protein